MKLKKLKSIPWWVYTILISCGLLAIVLFLLYLPWMFGYKTYIVEISSCDHRQHCRVLLKDGNEGMIMYPHVNDKVLCTGGTAIKACQITK
jgi:hypothetical protein